uniref:Uncharacterized protein n=1 Tax=Oryza brachyantha TaxID=4533 RepID=J3M5C0_ORYBR
MELECYFSGRGKGTRKEAMGTHQQPRGQHALRSGSDATPPCSCSLQVIDSRSQMRCQGEDFLAARRGEASLSPCPVAPDAGGRVEGREPSNNLDGVGVAMEEETARRRGEGMIENGRKPPWNPTNVTWAESIFRPICNQNHAIKAHFNPLQISLGPNASVGLPIAVLDE